MDRWGNAAEEAINSIPNLKSIDSINGAILLSVALSLRDISYTLKEIKEQNGR